MLKLHGALPKKHERSVASFWHGGAAFSSDIVTWRPAGDGIRREKLPTMPGNRWLGIVMLFSSENGELLAIMNDGVLQRMPSGRREWSCN